jgi:hydrogenase-4 membrane subunit HyfE
VKAWQVSVLVTTALILSELVVYSAARRWRAVPFRRMAGLLALGLFAAATVAGVVFLGTEIMDRLASVASALLGAMGIYLTYQSYRAGRAGRDE